MQTDTIQVWQLEPGDIFTDTGEPFTIVSIMDVDEVWVDIQATELGGDGYTYTLTYRYDDTLNIVTSFEDEEN